MLETNMADVDNKVAAASAIFISDPSSHDAPNHY